MEVFTARAWREIGVYALEVPLARFDAILVRRHALTTGQHHPSKDQEHKSS
ncbi:hypothetical protein ACFY05_21150 [Microtetraspora fusca]|uniref:Uncharacterized protein n=1 Tax=Microtetraspora fusca TaxID=1997 RepID=A0ABW6V885_MICFU